MLHTLSVFVVWPVSFFFFFNDTATTEIYTLSLHDALPIFLFRTRAFLCLARTNLRDALAVRHLDRKSTRLNSSHSSISYAVFCLKKKKEIALTSQHHDGDTTRHSSRLWQTCYRMLYCRCVA